MRRYTISASRPRSSVLIAASLVALFLSVCAVPQAGAGGTLRVAMTAADVPTTTGMLPDLR